MPSITETLVTGLTASLMFVSLASSAQERPSYGPSVNLETAKRIAAAASAEAVKNKWPVAIAIVDTHGFLVYYELTDNTQTSAPPISVEKARTAAMFRRPSKELEDNVAQGRVAVLGLPGATPIEGGIPIVREGRIIGGIGVSGVAASQDAQVARAGLEALK